MNTRFRRWLIAFVLVLLPLALGSWFAYGKVRQAVFLNQLDLVAFSTSMIGGPDPSKVQVAQSQADELGIDLFAAYKAHRDDGLRFSLACLLIDRQSRQYFDFCREHVEEIPWQEVRIWRMQVGNAALTQDSRDRILKLLLASPTSEAQLFAGAWYRTQGRIGESEDAYYAAMTKGSFWDSLDAADELLISEQYRNDAIRHHVLVLKEGEHLTWRSAASLVHAFKLEGELMPLLEAAKTERGTGPKGKQLIDRLTQHAEGSLGGPINRIQFFVCGPSAGAVQMFFMPHVVALLLPPILGLMHHHHWRLSIRMMLLLVTIFAVAAWLFSDGWRYAIDSSSRIGEITGRWLHGSWTAIPLLVVSIVVTLFGTGLLRSAAIRLSRREVNEPA